MEMATGSTLGEFCLTFFGLGGEITHPTESIIQMKSNMTECKGMLTRSARRGNQKNASAGGPSSPYVELELLKT